MSDQPVFFYNRKFQGAQDFESIQVGLESPLLDGKTNEEMWTYVISKVDEQIIAMKSLALEETEYLTMGKSLIGKTIDEFRGRDYLVGVDLANRSWVVTIADVQSTERWNPSQQQKQETSCLVFSRNDDLFKNLPEMRVLLLNKTDENTLAGFFGTAYGNWVNKQIELFSYSKNFKGKNIVKIGIRLPKQQPQNKTESVSAPPPVISGRPWSPDVLKEKLNSSAKDKIAKNNALDMPIHSSISQIIGAKMPSMFETGNDISPEQKLEATNLYHQFLHFVFSGAENNGDISANNLKHYEGITLAGWMFGKPLPSIGSGKPKDWFATQLDNTAVTEAKIWLKAQDVNQEQAELDSEPDFETDENFEIPWEE